MVLEKVQAIFRNLERVDELMQEMEQHFSSLMEEVETTTLLPERSYGAADPAIRGPRGRCSGA